MAKRFTIFNKTLEQSVEVVINIGKYTCLLDNIILDKYKMRYSELDQKFDDS